jgi:hypothetical protein
MAGPEARGDGDSASVPVSDGEVTRLKMLTVNLIPGHLGYQGGAASEKEGRDAANGQEVGTGPARAGPLADG